MHLSFCNFEQLRSLLLSWHRFVSIIKLVGFDWLVGQQVVFGCVDCERTRLESVPSVHFKLLDRFAFGGLAVLGCPTNSRLLITTNHFHLMLLSHFFIKRCFVLNGAHLDLLLRGHAVTDSLFLRGLALLLALVTVVELFGCFANCRCHITLVDIVHLGTTAH